MGKTNDLQVLGAMFFHVGAHLLFLGERFEANKTYASVTFNFRHPVIHVRVVGGFTNALWVVCVCCNVVLTTKLALIYVLTILHNQVHFLCPFGPILMGLLPELSDECLHNHTVHPVLIALEMISKGC